ncbi:Protein PIN-LIKES 7 [Vigna angularis]|uniref:Protein PIN-LIKES 7 n=1 Tax=Phaseolus angularis TaxID=3914 RepID=A0A8T0LFT2_PHAAN|nr:Protein PIN-LIKES 7 [Vigna angularis]
MGFWELLEVASAPVIEVLLISAVGVFMATESCNNLLSPDFRKSLNKVVFIAFTPSLIFASFAKNVSLDEMILWYHSIKVVVQSARVKFGRNGEEVLGGVFIWTYTYQLMRNTSLRYKAFEAAEILKMPNKGLDADEETGFLKRNAGDSANQILVDQCASTVSMNSETSLWHRMTETVGHFLTELMSPPTIATFFGFLFGGVEWLRNLIIGREAPLRVILDSIQLLGDGTIPCITVLLGGNLTQGMQSSSVQPLVVICIIIARLVLLPAIGFFVVRGAANFGLLPLDPLFQYVLVIQYALPPAMNISE